MSKLVPLDNVEHARLGVVDDWTDAASVNLTLVGPPEFEQLQREYPILFRRDEEGDLQSVALLGLDRGENLFLTGGEWAARYVPASFRRGPFFLAADDAAGSGSGGLLIDQEDPRVGESNGEPLFLTHGGAAPVLERAIEALRTIHAGRNLSRPMFGMFLELGLIAPVEIDVDLGDGTHYRLADFFNISPEGLSALTGDALQRLNQSGFLACAIHARSSLGNINRLIELKARKLAAASRD